MGAPRSVLVKMDIEESEFGVLEQLTSEDFGKIVSLHVEFHYNLRAPSKEDIRRSAALFRRLRDHLVVVDAAAGFYGAPSDLLGVEWPKLLLVSLIGPETCR